MLVVDEFNYLSIIFENTRCWNKQKASIKIKYKQVFISIDRCFVRTPNVNIRKLRLCVYVYIRNVLSIKDYVRCRTMGTRRSMEGNRLSSKSILQETSLDY
jgi:hypothetical protein